MLDFHLAWSPLQLYMAYAMTFVIAAITAYTVSSPIRKYVAMVAVAVSLIIPIAAFDVGTRQAELGRSKFDAPPAQLTLDKVPNRRNNATTVNEQFKQTIQEVKQ